MAKLKKKRQSSSRHKNSQHSGLWITLGIILGISLMYTAQTFLSLPVFQKEDTPKEHAKTQPEKQPGITEFIFEYPDKLTQEIPVYEYQIPEPKKITPKKIQAKKNPPPINIDPINMIIQVGSFRNFRDADRMKAKLAFIGIEANIQRVRLNKNDLWHRVRIAQFKNLNALSDTRKLLKKNKINYFVFKVKP